MKMNNRDNPEYLNDYLVHIKIVKMLAERTINEYFLDLRLLLKYLYCIKYDAEFEEIGNGVIKLFTEDDLKTVTVSDLYNFIFYTFDERHNNEYSRYRKTCSIRSFFKYLHKTANIISKNPSLDLEIPSPKRPLPKYLTLNDSKKLLETVDSNGIKRDYCIFTVFLNCGLRLSELCALNLSSIDFSENSMRVFGKGSKERVVYLNPACMKAIKEYLLIRSEIAPADEPALFVSRKRRRISKRRVQQIVDGYIQKTGLAEAGITTHKLRHTAATLMYQYGKADLITLKEVLGHESTQTTEIYTHLSNEIVRDAFENNPLADIVSKN